MKVLEIVKDLVKIDTRNPPGITSGAVEYIENLFSSYRTRIYEKEDGKENIVVEISRGKPELMLTSHLDTVPCSDELLNPVVVNGKLYGRGSCDAKGCVAAICEAALNVQPSCGLKLAFTADEEVGGVNGLSYVFEHEKADAVLIGEPTGCDSIGVLQAAVVAIDIEVDGKAGHTAMRDAREGAVYRAARYIAEKVEIFRNMRGDYSEYERVANEIGLKFTIKSWHAVFNPSLISGGIKRNVVAPKCVIGADVRFAPWIPIDEIRQALEWEGVNFKVEGFLQPYGILCDEVEKTRDFAFLRMLSTAAREVIAGEVKAVFSLGVGDSRHVRKKGIPAFYLGPGGSDLHGENEFVYIDELERAVKIYRRVVELFSEGFDFTLDD